MNILPYQLATTKDLLTSRAGLVCLAQLMEQLNLKQLVNQSFPSPGSNRGFCPSTFVQSLVLMLHEGGRCLDDLRYICEDEALRSLLGLKHIPRPDTVGNWLRRYGQRGVKAVTDIHRHLLGLALPQKQSLTLDIDAMFLEAHHETAQWSYLKRPGYMPMIGHIAETGHILSTDFRAGNVAPSSNNLAFIHQCEAALPPGASLTAIRIDAAGYQSTILDMCIERKLKFAIRARMNNSLKEVFQQQPETAWKPLLDREGNPVDEASVTRVVHTMQKSRHSFSVVIQRLRVKGQHQLDLDSDAETLHCGEYIYRAIAVSETPDMSDSDWVHWYNQRAEHSENRLKELKRDFGGGRMPCRDFDANALYFSLCALAFNFFVFLKRCLPASFQNSRAKKVRWRCYALAGKVVHHGRKIYLKMKKSHHLLLREILNSIETLPQAP